VARHARRARSTRLCAVCDALRGRVMDEAADGRVALPSGRARGVSVCSGHLIDWGVRMLPSVAHSTDAVSSTGAVGGGGGGGGGGSSTKMWPPAATAGRCPTTAVNLSAGARAHAHRLGASRYCMKRRRRAQRLCCNGTGGGGGCASASRFLPFSPSPPL